MAPVASRGGRTPDRRAAPQKQIPITHTFACRRLRAGVDIYTVSKLLRHASVVMSERYAHLWQNDLKAAVKKGREGQ